MAIPEVYFQKQRETTFTTTLDDGLSGTNISVDAKVHTLSEFNMVLCGYEFKPLSTAKEPYKNQWHDQDGDEEFVPDIPKFEAYNLELNLACKTVFLTGIPIPQTTRIRDFIYYLMYGGMFKIYIADMKFGKRNVRFDSFDDNARIHRQGKYDRTLQVFGLKYTEEIIQFSITLKVNDPLYNVVKDTVPGPGGVDITVLR